MKISICIKNENDVNIKCRIFEFQDGNPEEWRGITVFGELLPNNTLKSDTMALLKNARKLADKMDDKAQLLLIGNDLVKDARKFFVYGADRVFVYDDLSLQNFDSKRYVSVLQHFIDNFKPAGVYFLQQGHGQELSANTINYLKTIMPFAGETETTIDTFSTAEPDATRFGELVICEIP